MEGKMSSMGQDLGSVKGKMDKHAQDLMAVNNDVKNRPIFDPNARLLSLKYH